MSFNNYIGGEWVAAKSGATFERRNPADTRDIVGKYADSGAEDVAAAVAADHWQNSDSHSRPEQANSSAARSAVPQNANAAACRPPCWRRVPG